MKIFLLALFSYLFGSLPFAFIAVRLLSNKDLSQNGTGNIGVANAFGVGGHTAGILTILGELSKAVVPIILAQSLLPGDVSAKLISLFCALLGTNFSIFLKGKGGHGRTLFSSGLLVLAPVAFLILTLVWIAIYLISSGNSLARKLSLLLIPAVLLLVQRDLTFGVFGLFTALLFWSKSDDEKDDFVYYGVFQRK